MMGAITVETFAFDPATVGTGKIFPNEIEAQDWIGYHGTSSFYSDNIENGGFSNTKPVPEELLDALKQTLQKYGMDHSGIDSFKKLRSVSFSPVSELCLSYCSASKLGGQGLGIISNAINALRDKPLKDEDRELADKIDNIIKEIRSRHPVIYAVNLKGIQRQRYDSVTKAVLVHEAITPDRIIAKLIINYDITSLPIDENAIKMQIGRIFHGAADHYIKIIS
ncbi:hypothetical protein [Azospirillum picis]|uniref:Uncharacterized protein n=1 Tax=Azospirillum picis TaxID=488438 RepID=A0ABU0MRB6_9PROT|nr:hypothetical protein [Azospirillum picis]MBP2302451.1 hypothetical protein [Azospirillum picis]MDQ0536030.1 hypothetical protein [Azospirillum picis]